MTSILKCDADGCDHIETVPGMDRSLIGKLCPKCGANLLTEADCDEWLAKIAPIIAMMKALGVASDSEVDGAKFSIGLHESKMTIETVIK